MKKLLALIAVLALAALPLAACGDDDDETAAAPTETTEETGGGAGGGGGGGETVAVSAAPDGSLAFEEQSLEAPAGSVEFEFDNPASLTHDFCIEEGGSEVGCTDQIADSTSTLTADLEPGEYTFYCSVDGHREGGMEGTLTVE